MGSSFRALVILGIWDERRWPEVCLVVDVHFVIVISYYVDRKKWENQSLTDSISTGGGFAISIEHSKNNPTCDLAWRRNDWVYEIVIVRNTGTGSGIQPPPAEKAFFEANTQVDLSVLQESVTCTSRALTPRYPAPR